MFKSSGSNRGLGICTWICVLLTINPLTKSMAQQDTSFWFVAPRTWSNHSPAPTTFKLASGPAPATHVTISRPADPGNGWQDIQLELGPNDIAHVDIDPSLLFPMDLLNSDNVSDTVPDQVTKYGIHIQSDQIITGYYENSYGRSNPDIFALKGRNALGTEFITPFQNIWRNVPQNAWGNSNEAPKSGFDIVATQSNTEVYVVATAPVVKRNGGVYQRGDTIRFTLNRGETYRIKAASQMAYKHLGGSVVKSNKPIAVTTWDDTVEGATCGDLIGDQMIPTSAVGTEYVVMGAYANINGLADQIIVQPIEDNTSITITDQWWNNSTQTHGVKNPWVYNHYSATAYIRANKPVYVFHIAGIGCELGGAYLPPIDNCTGSQAVAFVRSPPANPDPNRNRFILNIVVRSGHENNFQFEGFGPWFNFNGFQPLTGSNGQWMYARQEFDTIQVPVNRNLRITNSTGLFHLGVINGEDDNGGVKYGYFSSFANLDLGSPEVLCAGQSLQLDGGGLALNHIWSTGETTRFIEALAGNTYAVSATFPNGCVGVDELEIVALEGPTFNLGKDFTLCESPITLNAASAGASYLWSNASTSPILNVTTAGTYSVTATSSNGCTAIDSITVFPDTNPMPELENQQICQGSNTEISAGNFDQYRWSNGALTQNITISQAGRYAVTVTDTAGCSATASMLLDYHDQEAILLSNAAICPDGSQSISAAQYNGSSYLWSTGDTTATIHATAANQYAVTVTDSNGCLNRGSMQLSMRQPPVLQIPAGQFCDDGYFTAQPIAPTATSYLWSNGATTANAVYNQVGVHAISITDQFGCSNTEHFELSHYLNPSFTIENAEICPEGYYIVEPPAYHEYLWWDGLTSAKRTLKEPGEYTLTVTDQNGCHGSTTFTIEQYPGPVISLMDTSICSGEDYVLTPGAYQQYAWSNGQTSHQVSFNQAGSYGLTITDVHGCKASSEFALEVYSLPRPTFNALDDCARSGSIVSLSQEFITYSWHNGNTTSEIAIDSDQTISVSVTDENGCKNSATTQIDILQVPHLALNLSSDPICQGQETQLEISVEDPDGNAPYLAVLSVSGQEFRIEHLEAGASIHPLNIAASSVITLSEIYSPNGCRIDPSELNVPEVDVIIHPKLVVEANVLGTDCFEGSSGATVQFSLLAGTPPWNLTYTAEGERIEERQIQTLTFDIAQAETGAYAVLAAVDANYCYPDPATLPFYVEVPEEEPIIADLELNASPSCHGVEIDANLLSDIAIDISWEVNGQSKSSNPATFYLPYETSVDLSVVAKSEFCSQSIDTAWRVGDFNQELLLNEQNVFSPDNDGWNDWYELDPANLYSDCSIMRIFNRWGRLIYQGVPGDSKWNGHGLEGVAPEGTYYVVFDIGQWGTVNRSLTLFRGQ